MEHHDTSHGCGCAGKGHGAAGAHPVDTLMQEHQIALAVLDAVAAEARLLRAGQRIAPEFWRDAIDFFVAFVDTCHHGKEEQVLFPALGRHGLGADQGPVAVMLAEHDQGRALIQKMRAAVASSDAPALAREGSAYVLFLREHIGKEDGVLFPLARQLLTGAAAAQVFAAFDKIEREVTGEGEHCRWIDVARRLCESRGIDMTQPRSAGPIRCAH